MDKDEIIRMAREAGFEVNESLFPYEATEDKFIGCEIELERFVALVAAHARERTKDLTDELQQKCSDWGTYWRAPDAHGVNLSIEQATELLRDALGVEVEITHPVRTKDLTDVEVEKVWRKHGGYMVMPIDFARAVIAADREKNK